MKTCKNCGETFCGGQRIDGKYRNLSNRKFCLNCSPFQAHNTRPRLSSIDTKFCPQCDKTLPLSEFYTNKGRPTGYCRICQNKWTVSRQQKYKQLCIDYKGGQCECCGYSRYAGALEFHHKDPQQKDHDISNSHFTNINEETKNELNKCLLLCANCHREEHARLKGWFDGHK